MRTASEVQTRPQTRCGMGHEEAERQVGRFESKYR
jgi:hypothetical protein